MFYLNDAVFISLWVCKELQKEQRESALEFQGCVKLLDKASPSLYLRIKQIS